MFNEMSGACAQILVHPPLQKKGFSMLYIHEYRCPADLVPPASRVNDISGVDINVSIGPSEYIYISLYIPLFSEQTQVPF